MLTGILKAQGLYKSYKDKEVLHNLDLTIEPGKIYGLIGRNGAGKTTLLGILTAQNTKDRGEVTYDGRFSIEKVPCFGACDVSPAVRCNGVVYGNLNSEERIIDMLRQLD